MTYQQLLPTMYCSVGLLYVFVYIIGVDMLVVEEIPYSPPPVMSSHTTEKLIIFVHPIFMRKWNVFMPHTTSYAMYSNILLTSIQLESYNTSIWMEWNEIDIIVDVTILYGRRHDLFWRSLFVLSSGFFWPLCLTDSDNPFSIFKPVLYLLVLLKKFIISFTVIK